MTELTAAPPGLKVVDTEPSAVAPEACLFLGEEPAGRRFVGYARRVGAGVDLAGARLWLELPGSLSLSGARLAVEHWRASRIVDAVGVEIGSSVLLIGKGVLLQQVAELCRLSGARSVEVLDASDPGGAGTRADGVICLDPAASSLRTSFMACRDRGTVVLAGSSGGPADVGFYPDVHKRGLRVRCLAPAGYADPPSPSADAFLRLADLLERSAPRA